MSARTVTKKPGAPPSLLQLGQDTIRALLEGPDGFEALQRAIADGDDPLYRAIEGPHFEEIGLDPLSSPPDAVLAALSPTLHVQLQEWVWSVQAWGREQRKRGEQVAYLYGVAVGKLLAGGAR
jgi:hypothetical protein